ncbi:MAG: hypothetical protein H0W50_03940 [Parachlamydiaceae bacterium]|nr:hypothetical protein [Parachlamydiaceae bacterium]
MNLKIIDSGKKSAEENMEIDRHLLLSLDPANDASPILHFYDWQQPSATYGYFSSPLTQLNPSAVEKYGLHLARRPTGGGIIFHQFDFAFSFLLPASHPQFSLNTLDNYRLVNTVIAKTILQLLEVHPTEHINKDDLTQLELQTSTKKCSEDTLVEKELRNFCMALPTVYDVIRGDHKLAGGSQRRTKLGFLHQASIAMMIPPDNFLDEILAHNANIAKAMKKHTFHLLGIEATAEEKISIKKTLKNLLVENFSEFS